MPDSTTQPRLSGEDDSVLREAVVSDRDTEAQPETAAGTNKKGFRFWMIFLAVDLATFLAALDTSVISTALPTITAALGSEQLYVWIIDSYLLASTATIPIYAQAANIYGRRSLTIFAVCVFVLGSGICGGAYNNGMMIAGRTLQGIGGGGILTMSEIIVCDMVSIRERGLYTGIIAGIWAIATVVGPIMGGAFAQHVSWRWVFYINLPISGVALVALVVFLRMRRPPAGSLRDQMTRIDWGGCALLCLAMTAIVLALSWAGTTHAWSSWQTLVPLVLGLAGLFVLFPLYEVAPWVREPMVPLRLFRTRASSTLFLISFVHSMLLFWVCYFLPVYFQAVQRASPSRSAVMLFPIATTSAPGGIVAGLFLTKTGKYRVWHFAGFALMTAASGLFTLLDEDTSTGRWVGFQLLFGFGCGFVFTSCLPPILASLSDADVATATGTWTFLRNFGSVWGIAIPAAVFNTRMNHAAAAHIADPAVRALLVNGGAYEHATKAFIEQLGTAAVGDPALQQSVVRLYVDALRLVWQVSIAFGGTGFLLACLVPSVELRSELNTEYGLEDGKSATDNKQRTEGEKNESDTAEPRCPDP